MGKLKTALNGLATLVDAVAKGGDNAIDELRNRQKSVKEIVGRVNGGYELLAMYLKQKAVKEKKDFKAWSADPLKDHFDSEVAGFVKNIESARVDALAAYKNWETTRDIRGKAVTTDMDRALLVVAEIQGMIDKKRKKFFQSKKFKAKLEGYEKDLNSLGVKVKTLQVDFRSGLHTTQASGPKKLAELQLTATTTVGRIAAQADLGLKRELDEIAAENHDALAKKFQAYATELKAIRSWVADADEMEAESEEGDGNAAPGRPDPKPGIKKIVIKMGSAEIGTAVAGEYERATKLLTIPVVVWKTGTDPLGVLQKRMTVSGDYADAAEGKFANDMKLDKVAGDMKKATFKGA